MIDVKQQDPKDDYIVLKVLVFPFINMLWIGVLIMVAGFLMSLVNRVTRKEKVKLDVMKGA